ncbi:hypothetical protein D3C81_1955130 [compost metagenome]
MVDLDEFEWHTAGLERRLDGIQCRTGGAVASIDHQLQRLERAAVDVGQQMLDERLAAIHLTQFALHRRRCSELGLLGEQADLFQTGVTTDRL